jgi:hypothetical protein
MRQQAQLELTIAIGAGLKRKGGGRLLLEDFLPEWAKDEKQDDPKKRESDLKAAMMALTLRQKQNG